MMNNKGQVWGYTMALGLVIIILALALAPTGKSFIDAAMNQTVGDTVGLDCNNESISSFSKGTCVIVDFSIAYFFGGLIFIGGAVVIAKLTFGGV